MASGNDSSRRSSVSNADSGISTINSSDPIHSRYQCFWSERCNGTHELDECQQRRAELRGKLGIYYSPNGIFKRFLRDEVNNVPLEHNPTGCTMVNLLIHKYEDNQIWLLFVRRYRRNRQRNTDEPTGRQLLLELPSSNPRRKGEMGKEVATRALETITNINEITQNLRSRLRGFLFVDASAIYPLRLTNDQARLLTDQFSPDEELFSLHWFPLSMVLNQIPVIENYLSRQEEGRNLAQVFRHNSNFLNVTLNDGNEQFDMWSVSAAYLLYIRHHVGFEAFLN